MASKGICFFIDYRTPAPLLAVALYTLRKQYDGNVHVVCGDDVPQFFMDALSDSGACSVQKTRLKYPPIEKIIRLQRCFNIKPQVHKICPFDINLMYDCDHVFTNRFDNSAFDFIEQHGLVSFHTSVMNRSSNLRALRRTRVLAHYGMKVDFLKQVNGGCVGSVKGSPLIDEWVQTLDRMIRLGHHSFRRLPDEYSLSFVTGQHKIPLGDGKWSYCVQKEDASDVLGVIDKAIAVHFCHNRYYRSHVFVDALKEAKRTNFMSMNSLFNEYAICNGVMALAR